MNSIVMQVIVGQTSMFRKQPPSSLKKDWIFQSLLILLETGWSFDRFVTQSTNGKDCIVWIFNQNNLMNPHQVVSLCGPDGIRTRDLGLDRAAC